MAITFGNYANEICELFRDVLRGSENYTTNLTHPIQPTTPISDWIISGVFVDSVPVGVTVRFINSNQTNAAQGCLLAEFEGSIAINVDTSGLESGQEYALNKLVAEIQRTIANNTQLIYQNSPFTNIDVQPSNISDTQDHYSYIITINLNFELPVN